MLTIYMLKCSDDNFYPVCASDLQGSRFHPGAHERIALGRISTAWLRINFNIFAVVTLLSLCHQLLLICEKQQPW
jgi:hypothetical protein